MKNEILDDGFMAKEEIKNKEDLKRVLRKAGYNSFFEHQDGYIIVQQGDAVKVTVHYENGAVSVKPKFPRIGNSVQVLASAVVLAIFIFVIAVPFPFQWIFALIGGQIVSYLVHSPRTKKLKERIEQFI